MNITISNLLYLSGMSLHIKNDIRKRLTIENPQYVDARKMNRWTGNIPETLSFYQSCQDSLIVPRGFLSQIIPLINNYGIRPVIDDRLRTLPKVDFIFKGELRDYQQKAVSDTLARSIGVLNAPTGAGKTIMGLAIVAARRQPTLIIVHNKELLQQWKERIETFLGIPHQEVGQIGAGKKNIGKQITVGIVNSIYPIANQIKDNFGHVIVDECHRTPSRTFTEAITAFDARYLLGMSATPYRRDGLTKIIYWYMGNQTASILQSDLEESRNIVPAKIIWRRTQFRPYSNTSADYVQALQELTECKHRNEQISHDVVHEASNGCGVCLALTDRKKHAEALKELIGSHGVTADILTGDLPTKQRQQIVARLNSGEIKVLVATGQLIGEGFDCKSLSTLFLAAPISYHGRLIQYLGRVLRPAPGKDKATVYDYVDEDGVFLAAAQKRQHVYKQNRWVME